MYATRTSAVAWLVLVAPVAFGVVALLALRRSGRRPRSVIMAGTSAGALGIGVALLAAAALVADGSVQSSTVGSDALGLTVRLDPLSVVMLGMITVLALVIFRFSCTYLDGDARHGVFLGRLATTVAAVEVLVLSGSVLLLVLAWITTSLALHQLLVFYGDRRRARLAARKKFVVARVGDGFLVAASVLLVTHFSSGNLGVIFAGASTRGSPGWWGLDVVDLAAFGFVVAALLKSAQFPTHGWLVEVMETPTPVSALLHAGILNAGPFLAIRMAAVLDGSAPATTALVLIGGFTALFASVVLLTQPAVKIALGYSSAAHMGFMLMVCGIGFYPAALLHLVAHSFYKAHAFLSSGSVIDQARAHGVRLPRRLGAPGRIAVSIAVALACYVPLAVLWGVDLGGDPGAVALGAILVLGTTQLLAPAFDSDGPFLGSVQTAGLAAAVTVAFFSLEAGAHALLDTTVPEPAARSVLIFVLLGFVLAAFTAVIVSQIAAPAHTASARRRALAVHLRNGLYANAWFDRAVGALRVRPVSERGAR